MRIGMISPLEMRVPPLGYGGTELVVSLLTEALVARGHDVTLFASGDSVTSATLVPGCAQHLRGTSRGTRVLSQLNAIRCLERADEFVLVHNHTFPEGVAAAGLVRTPMLTTLHGNLEPDCQELFAHYRGWYAPISEAAARLLPPKEGFAGVVYNGIDCRSYPFHPGPRRGPLLFLSRISPEKGPHLAIEVARRVRQPLVIAGNVDAPDRAYFEREIVPAIDGSQVRYVGEADAAMKRALLCEARCLLAPITWSEPFGLFMVEAMVCGTPVVALRRGSVPEVVADGLTGFVVDDLDQMARALADVDALEPERCRQWVESRFSAERMVDGYLDAYARVLDEWSPQRGSRTRRRRGALPRAAAS